MNKAQFDSWTRWLVDGSRSRRRALQVVLAGVVSASLIMGQVDGLDAKHREKTAKGSLASKKGKKKKKRCVARNNACKTASDCCETASTCEAFDVCWGYKTCVVPRAFSCNKSCDCAGDNVFCVRGHCNPVSIEQNYDLFVAYMCASALGAAAFVAGPAGVLVALGSPECVDTLAAGFGQGIALVECTMRYGAETCLGLWN